MRLDRTCLGLSTSVVLFLLPITLLLLWGVTELHSKAPLVDLRTTARPTVLFAHLTAILLDAASTSPPRSCRSCSSCRRPRATASAGSWSSRACSWHRSA